MATRWSDDQKATALDALQTQTLADAHHNTGIPKPTLIRWAKAAGITVERASEKTQAAIDTNAARWAERRPIVAEKAGRLAEQALDKAASLLRAGEYLEAQRVMTVMGVSVDKAQLLSGDATARTESIAPARSPELEAEAAKILHLVEPGAAA